MPTIPTDVSPSLTSSLSLSAMPAPFQPPSASPSLSHRSAVSRLLARLTTHLQFLTTTSTTQLPVMRVNQLDANQLDSELFHMLQGQLRRVFLYFHPRVLADWKSELELLLAVLVYAFTVHVGEPTPGAKLQNLVLSSAKVDPSAAFHRLMHATAASSASSSASSASTTTSLSNPLSLLASSDAFIPQPLSRLQKLSYLTLTAFLPYIHTKLTSHMTLHAWFASPSPFLRTVYRLASTSQLVLSVLSTVNFLLFLMTGRYATLVLRVLRIRLVYLRSRVSRQLSFDYMHQQLAFSVLTDFLTFALPFLPWRFLRSLYHSTAAFLLPHRYKEEAASVGSVGGGGSGELDVCGVCGRSERLNTSVVLPCLHVYCWYCCAAHMAEEAVWRCVVCDVIVSGVERWSEEREVERREKRLAEQRELTESRNVRRSNSGNR